MYAPAFAVAFVLLLLYNLFNAASLTLVIPFLEILFSDGGVAAEGTGWKADFYNTLAQYIAANGKYNTLVLFCALIGLMILLKNLFRYFSNYIMAPIEHGIVRNLRQKLYDHLASLPLSFFTGSRKGRLMNIVVSDVQVVQEAVLGTLNKLISDPIAVVVFLVSMLLISWELVLFSIVILPVSGLIIARIATSLKKRAKRGQDRQDNLLTALEEFISGVRIIRGFNAQQHARHAYAHANDKQMHAMVGFKRRQALASPLTEVLSIFVVIAILMYGGGLIITGESDLKASEFIAFIALFSQFLAPMKTLSNAITKVQKAIASWGRIETILNQTPSEAERVGQQPFAGLSEAIEIRNLTFGYDPTAPVLIDINLTIPKGSQVALVGPSGAGKSTLADLVCRFQLPTDGQILFDGQDYTQFEVQSLRRAFGIVTQEPILFHASVRENIAFGDPEPDDARIWAAAEIANAKDFLSALPEGLATPVGERGGRFSGGQRQRLALARAVYTDPDMLILDEATSALDTASERLVQDALHKLMRGRTSIVIAHRLSTIIEADHIVVFSEEGRIVEQGQHADLMAQQGAYCKYYQQQFGDSEQ